MEHGAEGADTFIAEIERHLRDRLATAQPAHGVEDAGLLAPGPEAETGFGMEAAGESPGAGIDGYSPRLQRALVARPCQQCLAQRPQPAVARHRKLEWQ